MKRKFESFLLVMFILAASFSASCSMLKERAAPDSLPVLTATATTNESQAAAWLMLARDVNSKVTPQPYTVPIDMALASLITLANVAAGYLGHRHATTKPQ